MQHRTLCCGCTIYVRTYTHSVQSISASIRVYEAFYTGAVCTFALLIPSALIGSGCIRLMAAFLDENHLLLGLSLFVANGCAVTLHSLSNPPPSLPPHSSRPSALLLTGSSQMWMQCSPSVVPSSPPPTPQPTTSHLRRGSQTPSRLGQSCSWDGKTGTRSSWQPRRGRQL